MKKRIKILLVIGVILVIGGYFSYKGFNLLVRYNFENISDVSLNFEMKDSITLDYFHKLESEQEYLEFKGVKIRNDFKNFEYLEDVSTENDLKYVLYDEFGNRKAAIMIGVGPTYVEMLKSDMNVFGASEVSILDDDLKDNGIEMFLKDNNITNDIQLFEYVIGHKDDKSNIFTSIKEMKENYILNYLMNIMLPGNMGITVIDGTYSGYIFSLNNGIKEVSILDGDKRYIFTFIDKEYFSDEYIYELLNTIVIENSNDKYFNSNAKMDEEIMTFTRTYHVIDVVLNNSVVYDSFKIQQFQDEEIVVVDIKKELAKMIQVGNNYEFQFRKDADINVEDDIKKIFESYELVSIVGTNKTGLDQVQESMR